MSLITKSKQQENYRIEYIFNRMKFIINDTQFVDLISLTKDIYFELEEQQEFDTIVLETDSKELFLSDFPENFTEQLREEGTIKEEVVLTEEKMNLLIENYKDNLFDINIEQIKLN
ncbi:hypothetical protein [Bacillus sp. AFS040349]|uniref:hypothetical protein n=1 Tax=Bacillus sp. AFS040349 TaxID=2033502 RepID=UPI000BFBD484|nr:hypothetical protein [Bacillus sp. AFS040349]PGT83239.1 hypothetical protein COD11_12960 [Bacillus sp. AFS040349]